MRAMEPNSRMPRHGRDHDDRVASANRVDGMNQAQPLAATFVAPGPEAGAQHGHAPQEASQTVTFDANDAQLAGIIVLALLAIIGALYIGRDLLLPVMMAAVLNLLLQPLMAALNVRLRLPMPVAALTVIILAFAAIFAIAYTVSIPSSGWVNRLPDSFAILKQKLAFVAGPLTFAQDMLHSIENMGGAKPGAVAVTQGDALPGLIIFGTASTLVSFFTTIVLLYFMLASGDRLLRGLIEVLPRFADKRRAVEIASQIQSSISSYLATVTLMNGAVGLATGLAMWACGLADPIVWGALAFVLNFVPILGPLLGIAVFFVAGLVALPWPFPALAPALLYTIIHIAEGETLTPLLLARRFELNPVLVILSLFFWHALWGVPGALLAVPLLAIFKIFADRIEPLKSIGHLIGA